MEKKHNRYKITLQHLHSPKELDLNAPLQFEFENHDEVFTIIEKIKANNPFEDENQAIEFAVGLKLFSEVMLKNRENPLFEELLPAFGAFMKKLKASVKE
ncbi:MAG: DUF3861 family protein [Flavobacterium sp.]|nr:MAG: DUF3861 family protein [Flavobacterium sp.]